MEPYDIIKRAIKTEKSVNDTTGNNKYHFEVYTGATKFQIRDAVEKLWPEVRVVDVNTTWVRGKRRRYRWVRGKRQNWKKAVISLRPGDTINVGY